TSLEVVDAGGQVVHEVELPAGARRTTVRLQAASEGVETHVLRRVGDDPGSGRTLLAEAKVVANVGSPVRVLAVASSEAVGGTLVDALEAQRLEVDRVVPERLPATRERLGRYDAVLLVDVPARDVHPFHRDLLERFVRDDGGGLVIVGGPSAFGPGGYYSTRLDAVSPLSSLVQDEVPEVAMTFVLDRSGSMNAVEGGATRMDLARSATLEAVELLGERSMAALVAFDAVATRVLPLRSTADVRPFREALGTLVAGGGTSIYPALVEAYDVVAASDAETRHVVVMTDGLSQEGDFEEVLGRIRSLGVDTTFVGIGDATSRGQLSRLAELGGGSLHFARDARALPGILTQEAMLLSADPIEERDTSPVWSEGEPPAFLEGPEDAEVPTLLGYVRTTPKPEASVHLFEEDDDDPLLATWRYGLGRVAAFATEADGPWAGTWTQRASFGPFWSQVARWTASSVPSRPYRLTTSTGPLYVDVVLDVDPSVPMSWAPAVRVRAQRTREVVAVGVLDRREPGRWATRLPLPPPDATTYVAEVVPPSSFEAGTIRHAFVHRDATVTDASVANVVDLEAVAPGRREATVGSTDGGGDVRRPFVAPDLRWVGPPRAWSLWATATFLLGLALRSGGVAGLGRRRRGGASEV
ncbi:MAG: VWA domain-containing protein, partial [Trueperaceae bacterium]|nr:VWA domain-containing protein [Trueperaceae bacterium]